MRMLNKESFIKAMDDAGMTAKELSVKAVVPERSINGIVSGLIQYPRRTTVMKLAKALGVEPETFVSEIAPNCEIECYEKSEWQDAVKNAPVDTTAHESEDAVEAEVKSKEAEQAAQPMSEETATDDAAQATHRVSERQPSCLIPFLFRRNLKENGTEALIRSDMITALRQDFKEPKIFLNYETEWGGRSFLGCECFQTFEERDERWNELMEYLFR